MISRRRILKYAALGSLSLSLGGKLPISQTALAQSTNYLLINAGSFMMGSPASEFLREKDEAQHRVTLSSYYMGRYPVTQREYQQIMGNNPSEFKRDNAPVENVTWYDTVRYCNALSTKEGFTPAYTVNDRNIAWNRAANGYRLPTEAEWEYAARAGTTTPFYTGGNITTRQANWYGTYPYSDGTAGEARQRTVVVDSFAANPWGLYDISGNVWEWCWDWYSEYDTSAQTDPTGPASGVYKIHRGGGWNDFGRHLRLAYRAAFTPVNHMYNIGFRVVRNAETAEAVRVTSTPVNLTPSYGKKTLILYYSWSGNTERLAKEIQKAVGGDLAELEMQSPYSRNYNTCLTQSRRDQQQNVRLAIKPVNLDGYDRIFLGYPTWWATMPMQMWNFLEQSSRALADKTIIPFASHGEGRLGQTISAIAKCVPQTTVKEAFSIMYSSLSAREMRAWIGRVS
jgi:formylglycine-generating enzyme required for sulfatase activity/flavodoxin